MTPTVRTLRWLASQGFSAVVVASWNPFSKTRKDVWAADILAVRGDVAVLINATDYTSISKRVAKAEAHPGVAAWCANLSSIGTLQDNFKGRAFWVIGWKKGGRGADAMTLRVVEPEEPEREEVGV